ncbi:MAG: hypothetical protein J5671_06225 [Bacteroidaceae bacterium]|nr:hypothetical protein [Bacteroidaceae bacterium]
MKKQLIAICLLSWVATTTWAQFKRLGENIQYQATLQGTAGTGDTAPFWFTNNRYGLGTTEPNSMLVRGAIGRDAKADSARNWRIGYGLDLVGAVHHDSYFVIQQAFADFQYKSIRLSVGQKERPVELKNNLLSTGDMVLSNNARPIPQIRLELPEFWTIPRTKGWLHLKAHIAFGMYTDNGWQDDFTAGTTNLRTHNSLFHSKAGFLKIGNTKKFPLSITGGLVMAAQFGGEGWNLKDRPDHTGPFNPHQKMPSGLKAFWHAFIPGGNDANDGDYANAEGNQIGSWHLRLDYHGKGWEASVYAEHLFEDHSQMFWQYPWKDMLYGGEVRLPKNPVVRTILYEHMRTTDQSGPIYHDATATFDESIYGTDNYYNHQIYGGWQHAGFSMGNALLTSPIYNQNGMIVFMDSRIKAHHIGIEGNPTNEIGYRLLYTHEKSFGSYSAPRTDPTKGDFLMVEASYCPHQVKGLKVGAAYGQNWGKLLGQSKGVMLTASYTGWINKKTKK